MFKQLQKGAFNGFDPRIGNNFDPRIANRFNGANGTSAGTTAVEAKPGQKMQINIILNNPTASVLTFELFNFLNSCTRVRNATYATGNYQYIPLLSYEGIQAVIADTDGVIGFNQNGDLEIRGDGSPVDPFGTVSCSEIAYAGLFQASAISAFEVAYVRFTCQTDPQIDRPIIWFRNTMAGGIEQNNISPRAYFRPNQFQNFTIDITVSFTIGIDSGLRTSVLAGERVVLALFIQAWTDQVIGQ